jgi:hypothetical protein
VINLVREKDGGAGSEYQFRALSESTASDSLESFKTARGIPF